MLVFDCKKSIAYKANWKVNATKFLKDGELSTYEGSTNSSSSYFARLLGNVGLEMC